MGCLRNGGKTRILSKIRGYIGRSAAPRCGNIMRNYAENRSIASCVIARVDLNIHDATKVEKRPLYRGSMLERAAIDNGKCIANGVARRGTACDRGYRMDMICAQLCATPARMYASS